MRPSFTVKEESNVPPSPRQSFQKVNTGPDMHPHALKNALQYSAEGSGTSCRQHPVPTEWLLFHKGQFGFSVARLPAWDQSACLADLWLHVFCVLLWKRLSYLVSLLLPSSFSFLFFSSQVVRRERPENLAGCLVDSPPTPPSLHHHP